MIRIIRTNVCTQKDGRTRQSKGLNITTDRLDAVLKAMHLLVHKEVLVGIPADAPERQEEDEPGNAALGYLHETGSPARNIPARPFLVPGVRSAQKRINRYFEQSASAALDGHMEQVDKALHRAGLAAQNAVRAKMTEGPFKPLAESTLQARARHGRIGAAIELERRRRDPTPENANAKPLIDTGQLRKSITYVVRKKSKWWSCLPCCGMRSTPIRRSCVFGKRRRQIGTVLPGIQKRNSLSPASSRRRRAMN